MSERMQTGSTHMEKIENKISDFQRDISQPLDTSRKN